MDARFLTQTELAERWSMSPRTLERWRWVGCGPPHLKLGGRVRYRLTDIETFEARLVRHARVSGDDGVEVTGGQFVPGADLSIHPNKASP